MSVTSIYEILNKYKGKRNNKSNDENTFYQANKYMIKSNNLFEKYSEPTNLFETIKTNIIIKALKNKDELDYFIETSLVENSLSNDEYRKIFKEKFLELPFVRIEKEKIYLPFFSVSTNEVYSKNLLAFKEMPYHDLLEDFSSFIVDPFDTYGADMFRSSFTRLIKVDEDKTSMAFFSYDYEAIFIINNQGSLDEIIYLFDRYIQRPNKSKLLERVAHVCKAYFDNNMNEFVYELYQNEFISYRIFQKICKIKNI